MMNDAEERFMEAVQAFKKAEDAARAELGNIDEKAFRRAIIDLDAAIPGLEGLQLGRAMVLKGQALWWISFAKQSGKILFDVEAENPERAEAHQLAVEGLALLEQNDAAEHDMSWANDLVEKTRNE
jgi:hypothetical protein